MIKETQVDKLGVINSYTHNAVAQVINHIESLIASTRITEGSLTREEKEHLYEAYLKIRISLCDFNGVVDDLTNALLQRG